MRIATVKIATTFGIMLPPTVDWGLGCFLGVIVGDWINLTLGQKPSTGPLVGIGKGVLAVGIGVFGLFIGEGGFWWFVGSAWAGAVIADLVGL